MEVVAWRDTVLMLDSYNIVGGLPYGHKPPLGETVLFYSFVLMEATAMKVEDVLPAMSKMYLNRVVGSFLRDVRLTTEDEMRTVILKNITEFQNSARVKRNLVFATENHEMDVLNELILIGLSDQHGYISTYPDLVQTVHDIETRIVNDSGDTDYVSSAIPEPARRMYSAVLTAAWNKDDTLNAHEKNILEALRHELQLSRRHHRLLESRIERFPQDGNKLHTHAQINQALKDLQTKGLVLRFKTDDEYYIIPEEVARVVRYEVGREINGNGYETLLDNLRGEQLKTILTKHKFHSSGTKAQMIYRIKHFDLLPSEALGSLADSELSELLRDLDGARVSGTKNEKIENIIDYYEDISMPDDSDPTDPRARYYDCFEQLASRNYKALRGNGVITKDVEIEHYFEYATCYLFEKKIGLSPMELKGSAHPDGRLKHNAREVVLWDNKSTDQPYSFPDEHINQFLGYIRADTMRPTLFLVIVYDYTREAVSQAQRLKAYSETDTDVALVKAADLKFVAENWQSYSGRKTPEFDLQVFNMTGQLTRDTLVERMSWVLGR